MKTYNEGWRDGMAEAAKIALAHKGTAKSIRRERGQQLKNVAPEVRVAILAEERGEDIASELIARDIRKAMA